METNIAENFVLETNTMPHLSLCYSGNILNIFITHEKKHIRSKNGESKFVRIWP